ncbi:MAG TPA: substrate-binding domain-containing protein [Casimicrobiaceae bacterium]|nr:substrate-binding domain-containing protein [Casimicrobiaceae bacterium]
MSVEPTRADPIAGISSIATRHLLGELAAAYERRSGQATAVESIGGVEAMRRVQAGEAFDFVVLAAEAIHQLGHAGRIVPESRVELARSGVAVAVAAGAPRPGIGDEHAVRRAVLAARAVGYSTGPSGVHVARLLERWGIAEGAGPRLVQAPPGVPVGTLLARGDVELGFQQLSELLHLPGIDVIGTLPPEIQVTTTFTAAACKTSKRLDETRALLAFLGSPEADAAKRRQGMEPA